MASIVARHGLEPAPDREARGTWREFLKRHWDVLWATDFFTAEVFTAKGLVTFYVLFFIHLKTRRVVLGGITPNPDGRFMAQVARNLSGFDGELAGARFLIHDRDAKYTAEFDGILGSAGIEAVKLPVRSPNLNAFAERFVRSIKEECLGTFVLVGQRFLRHVVREYLDHYHAERTHQGEDIGNALLFPDGRAAPERTGEVVRHSRLGGLLNFYHRDNAA